MMSFTAAEILRHHDSATLWPEEYSGCLSLVQAYQLDQDVRELRTARGEKTAGFKLCFTNKLAWSALQIDSSMWAAIWQSTTECFSTDVEIVLALEGLCQPKIEPECVFHFASSPPPGADCQTLLQHIDWIAPGFEIVQSHQRPGSQLSAATVIADGGFHAKLFVGTPVHLPLTENAPQDVEAFHRILASCTVSLQLDGAQVREGTGACVLDSPLLALQALSQQLAAGGSTAIEAGDLVTSGSWTDAPLISRGQRWAAHVGPPLGSIRLRCE